MRLAFLGGAQNVTGSRHLLEVNGLRILVDCGMHQERELKSRDWDPFPVPPQSLHAVLLTHAHVDHCGLLPKLVRDGYRGPIYCTAATADIARIILKDTAHLQQEDADFKRRRHEREGRTGPFPEVPLYTIDDAEACSPLFSPVQYERPTTIDGGVTATFHDAGHVLGSSTIEVRVRRDGAERTLLFSGDLGRWNKPIVRDPTLVAAADYVLVESTYGDRVHEDVGTVGAALAEVVGSTLRKGGNVIIPSFALERAQEVLYHLNGLLIEHGIPKVRVFVDSPMAVSITKVFEQHQEMYDRDMLRLTQRGHSPFDFPGLTLASTKEESKAINEVTEGAIIIAGSGMCTGGRIKHHLAKNISRPESTILFVGYQATGTLGRQIVDGAEEVRILGQMYPVRARIARIDAFSSHADRSELMRWLSGLQRPPRHVFVVHGEPDSARHFAVFVKEQKGWEASAPVYGEEAALK
ncbi:MAG: MBL fold metallo-hydrolase [Bacteroidetes bacterium]|nr:MBL fold metallo-hydrolase [Bacteroidota bacterium]MCL5025595.1 MBL fold metallo-hydrolase [Chloroflexota bacterium]